MSPILATQEAYLRLSEASLVPEVESRLSASGITSPLSLVRRAAESVAAEVIGEQLQTECASMQERFVSPHEQIAFATGHLAELGSLVLPASEHSAETRSAAAAYALFDAPARLSPQGWCWRSGPRVTTLSCNTHGDVTIGQCTLVPDGGQCNTETLEACLDGFTLSQDTSALLVTTLLFARTMKLGHLPEIEEHESIIKEVRRNPWGMPSFERTRPWDPLERSLFAGAALLGTPSFDGTNFLWFRSTRGQHTAAVRDGVLEILRFDSDGLHERPEAPGRRFTIDLRFGRDEIPDLLRGIYKTFARNPDTMLSILRELA